MASWMSEAEPIVVTRGFARATVVMLGAIIACLTLMIGADLLSLGSAASLPTGQPLGEGDLTAADFLQPITAAWILLFVTVTRR